MMKQPHRHLLVRASAGSGKTYQLVRRLIGLLGDGEIPESILAATFSRKAAGEFRTKLLSTVANAAVDEEASRKLAQEIDRPEMDRKTFSHLLGSLVRKPEALRLSTIDAFFLELVGLFRLELGIGTEIRLAAETADDFETRDLLRTIFTAADEEIRHAIFHLIEEDRESESVRSFQQVLEKWISESLSLYRSVSDGAAWGKLPEGMNLPTVSMEAWQGHLANLADALAQQTIPEESRDGVDEVLDVLGDWDISPVLPEVSQKWIKAGAIDSEKLAQGKKYFLINRKRVTLEAEAGEALIALARLFHAHKISLAVSNSKGAWQFLKMFEREYQRRRLQMGSLRFADLPHLLSHLSTIEGSVLAYRLDARIKHWLLDEFQDTSRDQWNVIQPFIEELFYDSEDHRSFYCVGDPKQAIYGWRSGDSRLFEEIREHYEHFEPRPLETETLAKTYRCAPAIVEFVNRLFGTAESFPEKLDPIVVDKWLQGWKTHETARSDIPGQVQVHASANSTDRDEAMLDFLANQRPWERGQSVAVLCRGNKEANRFESLLRKRGIPTIRDGALSLSVDFNSGRLLLALFQVLLHPGDTLALGVLRDNEASTSVEGFCGGEITSEAVRTKWESTSPSRFLADFETALNQGGWIDDAERRCLRVIHALVHDVYTSAEPDLQSIKRGLQHGRLEDTGTTGSVQILTIHRSKGLEFDMVLLPDLDAAGGGGFSKKFWTQEENGRITGVLESVTQETRAAYPPLEEWALSMERDSLFENICVHYVALTRAADSLHLFLSEKKGKSSTGIHRWIEAAYAPEEEEGLVVEIGEPDNRVKPSQQYREKEESRPPVRTEPPRELGRKILNPSEEEATTNTSPFTPGRKIALEMGHRVHETLAGLEWPATDWQSKTMDAEVETILKSALQFEEIRTLLTCPRIPVDVWRERAFDASIDDVWSSGVFDRVHLPDGWQTGEARPVIIDYKTNAKRMVDAPNNHTRQMQTYRKALAMILGIDAEQIDAILIYLRTGEIVEV